MLACQVTKICWCRAAIQFLWGVGRIPALRTVSGSIASALALVHLASSYKQHTGAL